MMGNVLSIAKVVSQCCGLPSRVPREMEINISLEPQLGLAGLKRCSTVGLWCGGASGLGFIAAKHFAQGSHGAAGNAGQEGTAGGGQLLHGGHAAGC